MRYTYRLKQRRVNSLNRLIKTTLFSHLPPSENTLVGFAATRYSTWGASALSRLGVALLETLVCRSSRSASGRAKRTNLTCRRLHCFNEAWSNE